MEKNVRKLRKIFNNSTEINEGLISTVINNTRQIIESNKLQEEFGVLNFYCNWFLHTELKQSMKVFRIINKINEIAVNYIKGNSDSKNFPLFIGSKFEFKSLRDEFIELYRFNNIPIILFSDWRNWRCFFVFLA